MPYALCTFTLLTTRSIIHVGISFWTAIVRLYDVYVVSKWKKQQTITRIINANPEWIKTYEKKENDLFCLYTNQPAGYFCSYIRPPGR